MLDEVGGLIVRRLGVGVIYKIPEKGGGTKKRGRETKMLKRGHARKKDGCFRKGGAVTSLRTMTYSK